MIWVRHMGHHDFYFGAVMDEPSYGFTDQRIRREGVLDLLPMAGASEGISPSDQNKFHLPFFLYGAWARSEATALLAAGGSRLSFISLPALDATGFEVCFGFFAI